MKKKCLFVNPMSNGKYLAKYFKERGVEIYALIEMRKVRSIAGGAPGDVSGDLFNLFDPSIYHQFFGSVEKVLNSGVAFDCIIPGSEHGVDTAELLAHQYGLSGNNPATTAYRRNKFVMQEQLRLHKLDYAKSMLIDLECKKPFTGEDLRGFSFPVILKPVNAAGMEDVFLCNSLEELNEKIESLDAQKINSIWVRNNLFVVQEYLDGEEFALDFVVHNDAPYICVLSKYMKNFKVDNKYITTESVFYDPRDEQYQGLIEYAKKVIAVLEISNGAAHVEFIANQDRICLIDVGARMRGGGDPWFYQEIYSSPLMWAINDKYVNDGQNLKDSTLSKYSVHLALNSSASGEFKGISNDENEALSKLPCLKELTLYPAIGQEYPQTTNLMTSVGVATIFGDRMDEVKSTVREVFSILSNHFGEWYKDIPPEIESCNENLPQSNPVLPLERAGFAAKQFS